MYHETRDYAVKFAVLVALRDALLVLVLASAELAKVFGGLWDNVGTKLDEDAAQRFSCAGVSMEMR